MKYLQLAETFEELSKTTSRLEKTTILANFIKKIKEESEETIEETVLLLQGRVFPEWDSQTVGMAAKLALKAISRATGHGESEVEKVFKKHGDIGNTVEELVKRKRQQTLFSSDLTLKDVFQTLQKLASLEGMKSQDVKMSELSKLLTSAKPIEAKFIIRTVLEDLRVGIAGGTMRDAITYAFFTDTVIYDKENNAIIHEGQFSKEEIQQLMEKVKRAFDLTADYAKVITHLQKGKSLDEFKLTAGSPCKVMLARKERTFTDAFARTGFPARLEYKYDGFRMQIHKKGKEIKLFTRRLEDVTKQFPDVEKAILKHVTVDECIIDGEAVGYDPKTGKYQPFQHISKRIRRKYDIEALAKELPVEVNIFDVLYDGNKVIIDEELPHRLLALEKIIPKDIPRSIVKAKGILVEKEEDAQSFYEESLAAGNEGVMIKDMKGLYEPGGRVSAWIKMKPIMDELDLVITEAEWGNGKRSAWMTSFTLAVQDEDGNILEIGKVGTGLKEIAEDEETVTFARLTELLKPLIIGEDGKNVRVQPEIILMIAYEEIQKSPTYSSGFALRFPRVLNIRNDKSIDDIATMDDIYDLYEGQ
ncbi:ATP-dependent DNA ligase [Candidatus Woesearchaeota archaeon]|nr:ATP-dependent DNA ligase [Candidatus Woesearchaeota archaeon]